LRDSYWSAEERFRFSRAIWRLNRIFQIIEIIGFWSELFRRAGSDETNSARDETIFCLPRRIAETLRG
jgi:hypothetical protein